MSSRVFQNVINQMKDATNRVFGVLDTDGVVVACNDLSLVGERWPDLVMGLSETTDGAVSVNGKTLKPLISWNAYFDFVVFVDGDDDVAKGLCIMAAIALNSAKTYYEEKHDRATFVKNIILDNILPGDVYIRAKELHFPAEAHRAVFLVRQLEHAGVSSIDTLQAMFPDKNQDFVLSINETDVAVIKQISDTTDEEELYAIAESIREKLYEELYIQTVIGIGNVSEHLRELADSYKEAQIAIEVGKVFDTEKSILNYDNLGIGRLIYQLPTTLCEIFLDEVFKRNSIDALDHETLFTINKFFENNLNVSETSRRLFVHRNTLVYRLGKIKKLTGLDLQKFDHAIVFKVALMVKKYLSSIDNRTM